MFYAGIDIGKFIHEITLIDDKSSKPKSLRFQNTRQGFEKLKQFLPDAQEVKISIEATGHYWLTVYYFLIQQNYSVLVVNPLQTDAYRKTKLRKTKTDRQDSFILAELMRLNLIQETPVAPPWTHQLKSLSRFHFGLVDQIADLKRQLFSLLDKVFPEFESLFSHPLISSARTLLKNYPLPEEIAKLDLSELKNLLEKSSRNKFSQEKAIKIKELATSSIGLPYLADAARVQILCLINHLEFIERQLEIIDSHISNLVKTYAPYLSSLPGFSDILAGVCLGEIGDISRFANKNKLAAFAGIDPTIYSSGEYTAPEHHMSKRGSPYLRRALWIAATIARKYDKELKQLYERKINQGKHYGTAIGAVARRLVNRLFVVLKEQRPYKLSSVNS